MLKFSTALVLAASAFAADPTSMKIALAGDSTVTDAAGWGKGFRASLSPEVECVNLARGGASTLSYRTAGEWKKVLASRANYVLIQFGHNDVPGKGPTRETDPRTTFRENMTRFVEEARSAGIEPVLVTSVVHRRFDKEGKYRADAALAPYAQAVRELAADLKVPLIDLFAATAASCEQLGKAACEAQGPMLMDKEGIESLDGTHYNAQGAQTVGALAAKGFVHAVPAAARLVRIP